MHTLRTWIFGLLAGIAAGAAAYYIYRDGLPQDVRERVNETGSKAVETGRKAAAERKEQLEERLEELVGVNGKK